MKRVLFILLILLFILSCGGGNKAKWTIIGYFDGNNDLDTGELGASWVCDELQQLEKVGSTQDVEIVVLFSSLKTGGVAKIYHIEHYETELPDQISSAVLQDWGTKDMSDPKTLSDFIKYAVENYPAEHYMLILMDHGGGWQGVCWDEKNGGGNPITLPELSQALSDAGIHFDIVFFAACLMGQVEVAYQIKDYADYMCASQNVMWAKNTVKSEWLDALVNDPDMEVKELAKKIVDAVYNSGVRNNVPVSMAAIDLSKMDTLAYWISQLAVNLATQAGEYAGEIYDAKAKTVPDPDVPAFVDLRNFVTNILSEPNLSKIALVKDAAEGTISILDNTIFYTKSNVTEPRGGLSIHFPENEQQYMKDEYSKIEFPNKTKWLNFLDAYIEAGGGGSVTSISVTGTITDYIGVNNYYISAIFSKDNQLSDDDVEVYVPSGGLNYSVRIDVPTDYQKEGYVIFAAWTCYDYYGDGIDDMIFGFYGDQGQEQPTYQALPLKETYTGINIDAGWVNNDGCGSKLKTSKIKTVRIK